MKRIFARCGQRVTSWNRLRSHECYCELCIDDARDVQLAELAKEYPTKSDGELVDLLNAEARHTRRLRYPIALFDHDPATDMLIKGRTT